MKRKKFIYKVIAVYLAFTLLFDAIWPARIFALTSGPSQPEVQSFEPVNTSDMVDPFTGDFNYNIPLLTVPGPNGGYPINIAYHAGATMEQEASWVGLGWNLNVGSLNRAMRGLPDDFSGERVKKTISTKPSVTVGMGFSGSDGGWVTIPDLETVGFEINPSLSTATTYGSNFTRGMQVYYNNYRGVGVSFDMSISRSKTSQHMDGSNYSGFGAGVSFSLDPQNGAGVEPSFSLASKVTGQARMYNAEFGYNTREGLYKLGLSSTEDPAQQSPGHHSGGKAGMSFAGNSYVPASSSPTLGLSFNFYNKTGGGAYGFYTSSSWRLFGSWSGISDKERELRGYGYMYEDQYGWQPGDDESNRLMDFNRENEGPITQESPYLAVPVFTNDLYNATGQGMNMDFRPYRSDLGVLHDPKTSGANVQVLVGLEGAAHTGVSWQAGFTRSYSGGWNTDWSALEGNYEFQQTTPSVESSYEPFYFKSPSEKVATDSETKRFSGESAQNFNVKMSWAPEGALLSFKPKVKNVRNSDGDPLLYNNIRTNRDRRANNVEYFTLEELTRNAAQPKNYQVATINTFPGRSSVTATAIDYLSNQSTYGMFGSQIGEYSILNENGVRYEYALPVYNSKQKEVVFAVPEQNLTYHTTPYNSTDASKDNNNGRDHYYSATEMPGYAYTHLLTAIYSADYVDLRGDGPSEDDLGYWVKFNYNKKTASYKWRTPFKDANYDKGFHSDALDDKASYVYGEKEIWYLNSIETKTHIAEFYLSSRDDGYGAAAEYQSSNARGEAQMKLDQIKLYAKADRSKVIKTVNFSYDYSLCKGVPNNSSNTTLNPTIAGKLTLKKIWFTYLDNQKGKLTPYKFYYREDQSDYNPNYNLLQMDRWGYYKPDRAVISTLNVNEDDPYVQQNNRANADKYMSAWNLYQVTLPSGGQLTVDYEADDYAYVQNKRATQMFRIAQTGNANYHTSGEQRLYSNDNISTGGEIYNRVYFDLETPTADAGQLQEYIKGIKQMYFKAYMRLKKYQDGSSTWQTGYDYVDGFCEISSIDFDAASLSGGVYSRAYVTLKPATILADSPDGGFTHPFSKAAWQYMKVKRPDLLFQSAPVNMDASVLQNIGAQLSSIGVSYFRNALQLLLGYYTSCRTLNYGNEIDLSASFHPSFIRLNTPDKIKVGGGHRVKSIHFSDKWNKMLTDDGQSSPESSYDEYGVEYSYTSLKGGSSGVASYEPLIGGEENPHRLPTDYYSSDRRFLYNTKDFYLLKPIGESYYPGAMVGYSRVTMRNLRHMDSDNNEINASTASGITVMEFYTTRDYPVRIDNTTVDDCHYAPSVNIPFVGSFSYNNHGYSQGYSVWLNDMNGKLKSVSTYSSGVDTENESMKDKFETKTEYHYQTQGAYTEPNDADDNDPGNRLLNLVNVMDAEGDYRYTLLGQSTEYFTDMAQHSGFTTDIGMQANVDPMPPAIAPSLYPMIDYSEQMFRSIVAMKITTQNGILSEVVTTNNGSTARSRNLMFDGYTGKVVLSSLTNEHEEPVYSYAYSAHWDYDKMGPAYKNYGANISSVVVINASHEYVAPSGIHVGDVFCVGDMVQLYSSSLPSSAHYLNCWVSEINTGGNLIKLVDESGALLPASFSVQDLRIIKSARANLLNTASGSIVSLSNPVTGRNFPLFTAFNTLLENLASISTVSYTDCKTGQTVTPAVTISGNSVSFTILDRCTGTITLPSDFPEALTSSNIYLYRFYKRGNHVLIDQPATDLTPEAQYTGTWTDAENCFPECLDDVLHAEALRFYDNWTYDYSDIGNPSVTVHAVSGTSTPSLSSAVANNPFRFGKTGIWHPYRNYVYQVDRKQGIPEDAVTNVTNTRRDGVYDHFTLFNWLSTDAQNSDWSHASTVSKYNHYGFELENRDVLGHYSNALYGYNNSAVTAVTSNASYYESAFDGFEDYASGIYNAPGHGHLHLLYQSSSTVPSLTSTDAHTGNTAVALSSAIQYQNIPTVTQDPDTLETPDVPQTAFSFVRNRSYVATAWFKSPVSGAIPAITVSNATIVSTNVMPQKIEGWQRVEVVFTPTSSSAVTLTFSYTGGNGSELIDDVRIQPFTSTMKSYVYDPVTMWLVAELDNRNFSTYYSYDEEGALVQVKKETEEGIATLKTARNNMYQHPN